MNQELALTATIGLAVALVIDLLLGEPLERFHPTVLMGKLIQAIKPCFKRKQPTDSKIAGICLACLTVLVFGIASYGGTILVSTFVSDPRARGILFGILLKPTFSIRYMRTAASPIGTALVQQNMSEARRRLQYIVRRDTAGLDQQGIVSATVETIAEGIVDGVAGPLFFYALFGIPGAYICRTVNTLDSLVGYKDSEHADLGWFSAKLDTIFNYVPARLTLITIALSAYLFRQDGGNAFRICLRDRHNTASINAGIPMSAMAGALHIQLKKEGAYVLGDAERRLEVGDISRALKIMLASSILFAILLVVPLLLVFSYLFAILPVV